MNRIIQKLLSTVTAITILTSGTASIVNATVTRRSINNADGKSLLTLTNNETYFISPACAPNSMIDVNNNSYSYCANIHLWSFNYTFAQQFKVDWQGKDYYGSYFTIRKADTNNMVLDVSGGIVEAGRNVWLYGFNGTRAQQWYFKDAGNGRYYIASRLNPNYVLDISGGGSASGTNIHIWPRNNTKAQQFAFYTCNHTHKTSRWLACNDATGDGYSVAYYQCDDCKAIINYAYSTIPN
jgi:hypothetical protein